MNTGYFDAVEIRRGIADDMEIKHLKVDSLVVKDEALKLDMSGRRIKDLYEAEPNTNEYTNAEKEYVQNLMGKNSSTTGGMVVSGRDNRVTGKSCVMGNANTVLTNNSVVIGNNNTIIHDNCVLVGNNCVSSKNNQTVIGGDNLSFRLPLADDVLDPDLPEQAMSMCIDPADGSLLFKIKYMNEIRLFRAPTYGQTIRLNTSVGKQGVRVDLAPRNI